MQEPTSIGSASPLTNGVEVSLRHIAELNNTIEVWDALMEYRCLESESEEDAKQGALLGVYRYLGDHFKVGAGYNFTDFSDDLSNRDYHSNGWFFDVVGKY